MVFNIRAGKGGKFKRARSSVMSVRLSPAHIFLLNQLAIEHGGAGRAIQIAVELLSVRKKPITIRPDDDKQLKEPFSFAAFDRTQVRIVLLAGHQYGGSQSNVIRACIQQLYDLTQMDTTVPQSKDARS